MFMKSAHTDEAARFFIARTCGNGGSPATSPHATRPNQQRRSLIHAAT
jgi:hypothetical protein